MNTKFYWILRSWWNNIIFKIKKKIYLIRNKHENEKRTKSFSALIFKMVLKKLLFACIICGVSIIIDNVLLSVTKSTSLDNQLFLDIVIGEIGVAGVILGLYCSNMASIFSSKYTNAPENITILYQQDILIQKCIQQIVGYITICVVLLVMCIAKIDFFYFTVCLLLLLTIRTIVTFSIAGNRAYDYSNTYRIAELVYPKISSAIKKLINRKDIHSDNNFHNHYREVCEKQLSILYDIAKYNENNSIIQPTATTAFFKANTYLLFSYLKSKPSIHYASYWFADKPKYQQWHIASDTETSLYAKYGRMLEPKSEKDYSWFESRIEEINNISFSMLIKSSDYTSIYNVLALLGEMPDEIVQKTSLDFWIKYILSLEPQVLHMIIEDGKVDDTVPNFAGVIDAYAVLLNNTIMNICNYVDKLNVSKELLYATQIATTSNYKNVDFKEAIYLNSKNIEEFYAYIDVEKKIEKGKITPDWFIEQVVSKEIYDHINYLSAQLTFLYTRANNIGQTLLENNCSYLASIWFSRLTETYVKISNRQIYIKLKKIVAELLPKKKEAEVKWDESCVSKNIEDMQKLYVQYIHALKKCSGIFALSHETNRTEFPDLLGYCYNVICDSLVEAICNNDYDAFNDLYKGFFKTVLLYQEYIRTDLANPINNYNPMFAYGVFASPMIEFSIISGLAILWGEFIGDLKWRKTIEIELEPYKDENDVVKHDFLTKMIDIINGKKKNVLGIGNRDLIQTSWEQSVSAVIRNHPNYEVKYGKHFDKYISSESAIFSAFSRHNFASLGVLSDTEELFLVLCVNPYVKDEEKFHTNSKWEELIGEEN